ncbi:MAG: hypothetical protein GY898_14235 [Proteobacteria bacterium]|nr:hypothetical protein [Pseudomonadota bacterium]
MVDLSIACRCGKLQLVTANVRPETSNQVACYCTGCRTYAERLGRLDILDEDGATERFQVTPASVTITAGREHLACLQQTKGGAFRWYARCCDSPIALTLPGPRVPFVGIDSLTVQGDGLNAAVGPVRARVNGSFKGAAARARKADLRSLFAMLRHLMPLTFRWWWRGDHKRSPFFENGAPVEPVQQLYDAPRTLAQTAGCR